MLYDLRVGVFYRMEVVLISYLGLLFLPQMFPHGDGFGGFVGWRFGNVHCGRSINTENIEFSSYLVFLI